MDDNVLIAAEAAVTSKRPGHTSIFAVDVAAQPVAPKQFYADPALLKDAIQRLKQAGFAVMTVSKFGLSILGPKKLYEDTFHVRLLARAANSDGTPQSDSPYYVDNPQNNWLISAQQSIFSDVIDGVALSAPSQPMMEGGIDPLPPDPKAKDWYLYPSEIPGKLKRSEGLTQQRFKKPLHVAVIDSGFYAVHPYFARSIKADQVTVNSEVGIKLHAEYYTKFEQWLLDWEPNGAKTQQLDALNALENPTQAQSEQIELLTLERNKYTVAEVEQYIADFKDAMWDDADARGHGTMVVANLLAVNPTVRVTVIKTEFPLSPRAPTELKGYLQWALDIALNLKPRPHIISISEGTETGENEYATSKARYASLMSSVEEASTRYGCIVLFASGNQTPQGRVIVQNSWKSAIIVGGAHYTTEPPFTSEQLTASDVGNGYPAHGLVGSETVTEFPPVPHVCGLCGPAEGYLYVPTPSNVRGSNRGWKATSGTSFATPQVAAVCAYILDAYPAATQDQVKEILIRTATPVLFGETFQGDNLTEIEHILPNGDKRSPGLVNIKRAVAVARTAQYLIGKGRATRDVVANATTIVETHFPAIWAA